MLQRGFQAQHGRDHRVPVRRSERLLAVHTGAQDGEFMINERLINPRTGKVVWSVLSLWSAELDRPNRPNRPDPRHSPRNGLGGWLVVESLRANQSMIARDK